MNSSVEITSFFLKMHLVQALITQGFPLENTALSVLSK